ncbi:hypothetical protein Godav_011862 [Gossypium davidsonii]|uniref:Pentatricopeptide repeat-containing protein n=2 Tax=Gossypium TaxID=3633 RepID=A0A7J8RBD6_GOSDV|nr:hypothetical protein [Gossypium davidsonii]
MTMNQESTKQFSSSAKTHTNNGPLINPSPVEQVNRELDAGSRLSELYQASKEWGTPLTVNAAAILIRGRNGDVKRMHTLVADMKENDIQPSVMTFVILINQLWRQEEGLRLMDRMRSMKGLAPNVFTYNCLIDGLCKCGDIEKGKEMFDQMNEVGVSPNVITLNILVDGMCRHGRVNGALNFFYGMQGNGLKGNAVTYTTLITAYCDIDHIVKVVDLFDQMLASGCSPDASVYHRLISGLCKAGRMDAASNVLSKLKEAGFRPDIVCYNSLVRGFCKNNMVDKAYDIIKEMEEAGVKPDSISYNSLIAYFCQNGNFGLAREAMEWMINGHVPTIATYGALIHAYGSNGNIKEAMKVFNDMSSTSKIPPNTITYNIRIESLCNNNDINSALSGG